MTGSYRLLLTRSRKRPMPDKLRQDDIELLRRSPLFDDAYYLRSNPDLAAKGVDPVKHYLRRGAAQGRDPSPDFSTTGYLRNNQDINEPGVNPLVHYLRQGRAEGRTSDPYAIEARHGGGVGLLRRGLLPPLLPGAADRRGPGRPLPPGSAPSSAWTRASGSPRSVYLKQNPDIAAARANPLVHYLRFGRAEGRLAYRSRMRRPMFETLYQERWPHLQPLPLVHVPTREPRVTVLTDSVNAASFFGGVGTALILGILLANRTGASLRLATRTDAPDGRVVAELEKAHGLALSGPLELSHVPIDGTRALAVGPGDVIDDDVVVDHPRRARQHSAS